MDGKPAKEASTNYVTFFYHATGAAQAGLPNRIGGVEA